MRHAAWIWQLSHFISLWAQALIMDRLERFDKRRLTENYEWMTSRDKTSIRVVWQTFRCCLRFCLRGSRDKKCSPQRTVISLAELWKWINVSSSWPLFLCRGSEIIGSTFFKDSANGNKDVRRTGVFMDDGDSNCQSKTVYNGKRSSCASFLFCYYSLILVADRCRFSRQKRLLPYLIKTSDALYMHV